MREPESRAGAEQASDLSEAWDAFFRAARRATGRAGQASRSTLSFAQLHLVRPLGGGRASTVTRLAADAGVAQPTATRMLDHLERAGVVARSADRHDRRVVLVRLTPDGEEALEAKQRLVRLARERVFAGLSEAERREAVGLLHRLAGIVEEL